jgi:N utilization substance protein A
LAARLTGWDIDILTPDEYNKGIEQLTDCVKSVDSGGELLIDKLIALGIISVLDLEDVGAEPLVNELKVETAVAKKLVSAATEKAKVIAAELGKKQAEDILREQTAAPEKDK